MPDPERLATIMPRSLRQLARRRRLAGMTTPNDMPDAVRDYEVARRIALLIEDEAENDTDGRDPKRLATDYIENVLDNGWISSSDDVPVWELVELLGHDRDDMDSLAVFHQIVGLVEENDFFN